MAKARVGNVRSVIVSCGEERRCRLEDRRRNDQIMTEKDEALDELREQCHEGGGQ